MNATHGENKNLRRAKKILDRLAIELKDQVKETFSLSYGTLSELDPALNDDDLLRLALNEITGRGESDIKAEIRNRTVADGSISNPGYGHVPEVWFYISSKHSLDHLRDRMSMELKNNKQDYHFILNAKREFYVKGQNIKHRFSADSDLYRFLRYMAERKGAVSKGELYKLFELEGKSIRKRVDRIKEIITKKFGVPRNSLFQNEGDNRGYKVTNISLE